MAGKPITLKAVKSALTNLSGGRMNWGGEVTVSATSPIGAGAKVVLDTQFVNFGLGVDGPGSHWHQIDYLDTGGQRNKGDGKSEQLILDFGGNVTNVTLGIGQIGVLEYNGTPETGRWIAYNTAGKQVGSGINWPQTNHHRYIWTATARQSPHAA